MIWHVTETGSMASDEDENAESEFRRTDNFKKISRCYEQNAMRHGLDNHTNKGKI
jgi:hypothetical protein